MISIFFDLETSDYHTLGQILNYSFIAVNENFDPIDELSGLVRISRLQLPAMEAILTNRINVLVHQKYAKDGEHIAARKIAEFLSKIIARGKGRARLIGFNSAKFDIPYLRTTLIRNGVNAFPTGLQYGDLIHLARRLLITNPEFAKLTETTDTESGARKRSCSLQHLSHQFELLSGAQSHESRDDVLLTIGLAKIFKEKFGADIRTFVSYEGLPYHESRHKDRVLYSLYPQYDPALEGSSIKTPAALLYHEKKGALWVDLERYKAGEGKNAVFWKHTFDGNLFLEEGEVSSEVQNLASKARKEFSKLTIQTYFERNSCDIEANIYNLDFDMRDALRDAIWKDDELPIKNFKDKVLTDLYLRYKARVHEWGSDKDDRVRKFLKKYVQYRYGGEAGISKQNEAEKHPHFRDMMNDIEQTLASNNASDAGLARALKTFYEESDLYKDAIQLIEQHSCAA